MSILEIVASFEAKFAETSLETQALENIKRGIAFLNTQPETANGFWLPELVNSVSDIESGKKGVLRVLSDAGINLKCGISVEEAYFLGFLTGTEKVSPVGRSRDIPPVVFLKFWTWILKEYHRQSVLRLDEVKDLLFPQRIG